MGHKVHPIGFRLGIVGDWQAHWFASRKKVYRDTLLQDIRLRQMILNRYKDAAISKVEIERRSHEVRAIIHSARPGIVIGRGGQRVEELRKDVERATGSRVRVDIQEIRQPELDALLVAQSVADQISRRVSYRRAVKQAVTRSMQAGAQGIRIIASGRLGGAEIARREKGMAGRVPLHTIRADIDFGIAEAMTQMGKIGIKVWLYRGNVLVSPRERAAAERVDQSVAGPATPPEAERTGDAPAEAR
ncbi:MAG: 30S ribosomal protein S3 [Chloroflexi bacterium]|nr:30S ribosomal protein S3 [Chloroflexota bacterium]